jgi:hypothetical protein
MASRFKFGHKPQKKSWDSSKIDQELEYKKIGLLFLGLTISFILISIFVWWINKSLS